MKTIIVRGRKVVCRITDQDTADVVDGGAVVVQDGAIAEVGRYDELLDRYQPDEVIGSNRHVVIPGLINAHHHVGLTPFQLGSLDMPLETWIIARWALREVDPYLDTLWCAIQMIESGITTVQHNQMAAKLPQDMSLYEGASQVVNAYGDSGMRVAFSMSTRDQNQLVYEDDEKFLATLPSQLADRTRERLDARPITLEEYLSSTAELHARREWAKD